MFVKIIAIVQVNMTRLMRDRLGLFFIFLLPFIIILVMGAAFGGSFDPRLAVVVPEGELAGDLVSSLGERNIEVSRFDDLGGVVDAIERGRADAGLVLRPDFDSRLLSGEVAEITYVTPPNSFGGSLRTTVEAAVADQSAAVRAAAFAAQRGIGSIEEQLVTAEIIAQSLPAATVVLRTTGDSAFPIGLTPLDHTAQSQLVLFIFITSLTAADKLILSRTLGVSRRMVSTPTTATTVLVGETLGRFAIAMMQGLLILLGTAFGFGIDWGEPVYASIVLVVFALVGTGGAMLVGSLFRTPEQSGSIGVFVGLILAALGGAMVPYEIFPAAMQTIAKATPHYWAIHGFRDLVFGEGGFAAIQQEVAVLSALAVVLLTVASIRFRKSIIG